MGSVSIPRFTDGAFCSPFCCGLKWADAVPSEWVGPPQLAPGAHPGPARALCKGGSPPRRSDWGPQPFTFNPSALGEIMGLSFQGGTSAVSKLSLF